MTFKKSFIEEKNIRIKALDLLSRREHSFKELYHKLKDRVDSKERLLEEINLLKKENLQSDERFSESYTRSRTLKGFGPEKISYELKSKGIEDSLIKKIVYSEEIDWIMILRKELNKKYSIIEDLSSKDILKIKKFFSQRGFTFDQINKLL